MFTGISVMFLPGGRVIDYPMQEILKERCLAAGMDDYLRARSAAGNYGPLVLISRGENKNVRRKETGYKSGSFL